MNIALIGLFTSVGLAPAVSASMVGTFDVVVMWVVLSPAITLFALILDDELVIRMLLTALTIPGIKLTWWVFGASGGVAHRLLILASNISVLVWMRPVISVESWLPLLKWTLPSVSELPLPMTGIMLSLSRWPSACRMPWHRIVWTALLVATRTRLI